MKSKILKSIVFLIIALTIIMLPNLVKARYDEERFEDFRPPQGTVEGADAFIDAADGSPLKDNSLKDASDTLASTLMIFGVVASMVVITALGIKFMTGSVEEKAKVKETLIPFTIGCIIIFGGYTIWNIVLQITQSFK